MHDKSAGFDTDIDVIPDLPNSCIATTKMANLNHLLDPHIELSLLEVAEFLDPKLLHTR